MPKRIQRKRTKGWRMPEGAVYVGRPALFGNMFVVGGVAGGTIRGVPVNCDDARTAIRRFREYATAPECVAYRLMVKKKLRGKDLACWCALDQSCHGDVLLEIANA